MGSKESKALAEASASLETEIQRLSDQVKDIKENFDEIRKNLFPQKEILTTLTKIEEESSALNQGITKLLDTTEEQQVRTIIMESQQIQLAALQEDQVKHLDEIKRNFNSRIAFYDKKVRDIKSACHYLENECFETGSPEKSFITDDGKVSAISGKSKTINKNFNKRMNDSIGSGMKQSGSIRGKLHKARMERWFTLKYEKRSLKFETNENTAPDNLSTMLFTGEDEEEDLQRGQLIFDMSAEELEAENGVGLGDL